MDNPIYPEMADGTVPNGRRDDCGKEIRNPARRGDKPSIGEPVPALCVRWFHGKGISDDTVGKICWWWDSALRLPETGEIPAEKVGTEVPELWFGTEPGEDKDSVLQRRWPERESWEYFLWFSGIHIPSKRCKEQVREVLYKLPSGNQWESKESHTQRGKRMETAIKTKYKK